MEEVFILNNGPKGVGLRFFSDSRVTHDAIMGMFPQLRWTKKENQATRVVVPDGAEHVGERLFKRNKRLAHRMIPWSKFKTMYYQGDLQRVENPVTYHPFTVKREEVKREHIEPPNIFGDRNDNRPPMSQYVENPWPQLEIPSQKIVVPDIFAPVENIPDHYSLPDLEPILSTTPQDEKVYTADLPSDNPSFQNIFSQAVPQEHNVANFDNPDLQSSLDRIYHFINEWTRVDKHISVYTQENVTNVKDIEKAGFFIRLYYRLAYYMRLISDQFPKQCSFQSVGVLTDSSISALKNVLSDMGNRINTRYFDCKDTELAQRWYQWQTYFNTIPEQLYYKMETLLGDLHLVHSATMDNMNKEVITLPLFHVFRILFNQYCRMQENLQYDSPAVQDINTQPFETFVSFTSGYVQQYYTKDFYDPYHVSQEAHPCTIMEDMIRYIITHEDFKENNYLYNKNIIEVLKDPVIKSHINDFKDLFSDDQEETKVFTDENLRNIIGFDQQKYIFPMIVLLSSLFMMDLLDKTNVKKSLIDISNQKPT